MSPGAPWPSRGLEVVGARKNVVREGVKRVSVAHPVLACACCIDKQLPPTKHTPNY